MAARIACEVKPNDTSVAGLRGETLEAFARTSSRIAAIQSWID